LTSDKCSVCFLVDIEENDCQVPRPFFSKIIKNNLNFNRMIYLAIYSTQFELVVCIQVDELNKAEREAE
jgi:hypothetical protein